MILSKYFVVFAPLKMMGGVRRFCKLFTYIYYGLFDDPLKQSARAFAESPYKLDQPISPCFRMVR